MLEPALPEYLNTQYAAKPSQRGGTLIAEDVWSIEEHRERVLEPDGYRPEGCPRCGTAVHGHGCRCRRLRDQPDSAWEEIRRFLCPECEAVWQVLPAFLARHLQRTWGAIQSRLVAAGVLERTGSEWRVRSIPTTLRRWSLRLAAVAVVLTQALIEGGAGEVSSAVTGLGGWCSRRELVEGLAECGLLTKEHKLAELASWVHRLTPGIRVM
jgi:hypothetical protein